MLYLYIKASPKAHAHVMEPSKLFTILSRTVIG